MAKVILKPRQEEQVFSGHPWIYNTQISRIEGEFNPADIVDIMSVRKKFLARGYINPKSSITVRILTRNQENVDKEFFTLRIKQAIDFRRQIIGKDTDVYRLFFTESDFLPGLVIDVYSDYIVMQTLTLGMEQRKDILVSILKEIIHPKGIYLRNDVPVRTLEGLPLEKKIIYGKFSPVQEVVENGIKFLADIENGQKTGMYIDQRENRFILKNFVKQKKVLDCFCYNGAFSVYAACLGAEKTVGIEISAHALKTAKSNMELNKIDSRYYEFKEGNAFDELKNFYKHKEKFDMVILDPPSFTKSKETIEGAIRGYREINLRAMAILNQGGILISATCSYHVSSELLKEIIQDAAKDAGRIIRLIEWRTQAKDHPILLNIPSTSYLKCLVAQVL